MKGLVAQWITRLTTDQKIPGSNPGRFGAFAIMCKFTVYIAGMQSNKMNAYTSCISLNDVLVIECVGVWGLHFHIQREKVLENPGIDPGTSHMLSERSTI